MAKPRINSRSKGQRGEREAINILQPVVIETYAMFDLRLDAPLLQRNTIQAHKGGYDVVGIDWLALEVKNCEVLDLDNWWQQTLRQATNDAIPVLMYKQNRRKFRVRMVGWVSTCDPNCMISPPDLPVLVDISLEDFLLWFQERLYHQLQHKYNYSTDRKD